ncbi:MAG: 3-deoxy-manno-octulosonate cytidylyltransferase [Thiothrix sp.]|nr:MAG: 3-deoxy-manno-octulosonate cytidylyltransferase [Thiothrix sp.]
MKFRVVIPARYGSSRLPGKPLRLIAGKTMIEHVCLRAQESGAQEVIVATDDKRVADAVSKFGGDVVMTSAEHLSGTDRLAEVAQIKGWLDSDVVVNLQGDEPLMDPALVGLVADDLCSQVSAGIATLATPITQSEDIFNPGIVKVVTSKSGRAIYFSRAPIPWVRGDFDGPDVSSPADSISAFRHLGIYAYRVKVLKKITSLPVCAIEKAEALEQLRALWEGIDIHVSIVDNAPTHGVDTEEDLERVIAMMG